jgi:RNA polymerase sigma-70 factor (ECF subfamily)
MEQRMDEQELRAMLQEHHLASYGWAGVCGARWGVEAEDVLQTVYLKILNGQARYEGRAMFKTWLFSVIRNTALDERRWRWLEWLHLSGAADAANRHAPIADPSAQLELSERTASFRETLARLPARQREVLHLVFYQDLSLQEAADVMGVSIGSVRTHYDRGKQRLRAWIGKEGDRDV